MKTSEIIAEITKFVMTNIEEQVGAIEMIDDVVFDKSTGKLNINYGGNNCITAHINVSGVFKTAMLQMKTGPAIPYNLSADVADR